MRRLKEVIKRFWPQVRLRTILTGVLVLTAALPLLGISFFRLYENTLVRQTESELIMQGAVMAAAYAQAVRQNWPEVGTYGVMLEDSNRPLIPRRTGALNDDKGNIYRPINPVADLNKDAVLPVRPIASPGGDIDVTAFAAANSVQQIFLEATLETLAGVRVTDANGTVVLGRSEVGMSLASVPELKSALSGRHVTTLRKVAEYESKYALEFLSRASSIRVFYARPVIIRGRIVGALLLSRSPRSLFRGIYEHIGQAFMIAGAVLVFIVILAGILSRSITRPVDLLNQATHLVARGEYQVPPAPTTAAVEVQQLFGNFQVMADTIETRSTYIRDFATAVSHEFKTPLTAIRGAIELLLEHNELMDEAERIRFLSNISNDAERLNQLVTRLLELARADVMVSSDERIDVPTTLEEIAKQHRSQKLDVDIGCFGANHPVCISVDALTTALTTLITNAAQHGASKVSVAVHGGPEETTIKVSDNGKGIAPDTRKNLFTPFYTTRRDNGGTGLGLVITRSLLEAYGGTIELAEDTMATTFVIVLENAEADQG